MEQEQCLELKMLFLLGYNLEIVIVGGELTFGGGGRKTWREESIGGGIFLREGMSKFLVWLVGRPPLSPQQGKPCPRS